MAIPESLRNFVYSRLPDMAGTESDSDDSMKQAVNAFENFLKATRDSLHNEIKAQAPEPEADINKLQNQLNNTDDFVKNLS